MRLSRGCWVRSIFMRQLKILLVDDNPEFLRIAASFLGDHSGVQVVAMARSANEALRQVNELRPDVVVMELSMPDMNGLEATRRIKASPASPKVVLLTIGNEAEFHTQAHTFGA